MDGPDLMAMIGGLAGDRELLRLAYALVLADLERDRALLQLKIAICRAALGVREFPA